MRAKAKAASPLAILLTLALIMPAITVVVPALAQEQSSPAPTPLQYPVDEKQRAELTIRSAQIALFKAESFINYTKSALSKANATELAKEALDSATTLLNNAKALLEEAKAYFDQGAYENATLKAMEAMRLCREAYRTLHESLEEKGFVKPERPEVPEVQGRGILVAVNRSLERIERLKALIGSKEVPQQIIDNLAKAEGLLNISSIQQLLVAGNVSEVARRLAEAEKLIGQAYGLFHSTVKAKVAERIEKYKSKVLEELGKAVNATALNEALKGLGLKSFEELKSLVEDRVSEAKKDAKAGIDKALQKLKEVRDKLEELRKSLPRPPMPVPPITPPVKPPVEILPTPTPPVTPPSPPTPTPPMPAPPKYEAKLSVKAEATREGNYAIVKVVVENTGNVTILFSNAALNLVIEKNVDGKWVFYYSPISAQVITKLGPRETKALSLKMKAEPGLYRAVVRGLVEGTMQPVVGSAEFTIT